ncbi:hypothetical protein WG66_011266 [Moniliophthora roreri]|nr:hypothetical protein WG66_011266 [Moniliophthora roreri]
MTLWKSEESRFPLRADGSKNSSPKTRPNTSPTPVKTPPLPRPRPAPAASRSAFFLFPFSVAIKRPGNPALSSFCNWVRYLHFPLLAHLHPPSGTTYHELSLLNTSRSLPVGAHAHQPNVPSGLRNSG